MNGKTSEEITRYELESYVAVGVERPSMTTRQTNAIQKMISLPEKSFNELISDVINEIHRRNNMPHLTSETPMQKKLCKIHEEGFKNLVLDILLVMDQRSPGKNRSSDVDDLIGNLDRLISSLKEDMMNEEKMVNLVYSEHNIVKKVLQFVKYIHHVFGKSGEDTRLVEHVMEELSEYSESETLDGFGLIFDVDAFLKKCDESDYKDLPEYKYHRDNIERLSSLRLQTGIRERLVRHEISQIYSTIALRGTNLEEIPKNELESKVHDLVGALYKVKNEIDAKGSVEIEDYLGDVIESVKGISSHIEKDGSIKQIYVDQLRSEIDLLEQIDNKEKNNGEIFIIVFSAVDLIRKMLIEISQPNLQSK